MTQATPNPWWNNPYKPTQILGRSPNPPIIATTLRAEDAELIVRAVNERDELIAALEMCIAKQEKVANWLTLLAVQARSNAETSKRFKSLADACMADALNYQDTADNIAATTAQARATLEKAKAQ